ncbi:MAG: DUF3795 domain-containing protein [Thermoleophilia bacterium]|nr:DUF3795 domain-containing protein [Thermoleophilia bacterium]
MTDSNHAPVCGVYCGSCHLLWEQCSGCGYVDGRPFWTASMGVEVCPLHECCRDQKHLEHCGMCADFACGLFLRLRDPEMSDEQFEESLRTRQEALRRRMEVGTEQWLVEVAGRR